jgi:Holliday junction resolvasome RuvABC DNA-binding subunit
MDYTDPANRRLRDEPTLPLSPEEVQIAVYQNHAETMKQLFGFLNTPTTTTNHEKETPDSTLN